MSYLLSLLTALPDLIKSWFGLQSKKLDTAAIASGNAKDVDVSIVQAESARTAGALDAYKEMLKHPVFWIAWGLGVFPVMTYHATVFLVSTFPYLWFWLTNIPASQAVLKVPQDQIEFGKTVVGNVFLLTGASTVVAGIAQAWNKRA